LEAEAVAVPAVITVDRIERLKWRETEWRRH
jgi:hypothetical protein